MPASPLSPLIITPVVAELEAAPSAADASRDERPLVAYRAAGWIALGVTGCAFAPLLAEHVRTLWNSGEYQHVPLVIAAIVYLHWQRWPRQGEPRDVSLRRPVGMLIGLVGLLGAIILDSPPAAMLAFVPAALSSVRWMSRTADPRQFLGPGLLLLLLVPLPFVFQAELVHGMKGATTSFCGLILDAIGVNHTVLGFAVAVPGKRFFVSDGCSGVNSLFGMVSLAVVLAVWWRLPWTLTLSMIPASLAAVLIVNVLRIVIIVTAYAWHGVDLSSGAPHQWLGLALLPLSLLLVVGMVSWTQWALAPIAGFGDSPISPDYSSLFQQERLRERLTC